MASKVCIKCNLNKNLDEYYHLHSSCIECIKAKRRLLTRQGYDCWRNMQKRCTNINNPSWKYYGAKGRFVCPSLANSFEDFIEIIGTRPSTGHSIDRIDNHSNYTCGNCFWCIKNDWNLNIRWATNQEQALNKTIKNYEKRGISKTRNNTYRVRISINGKMEHLGIYKTLKEAIKVRNKTIALTRSV